jgi:aminopeptidase
MNQTDSIQPLFSEKALEDYAQVLFWGLETARQNLFKPDDTILIQGHLPSLPLIKTLHKMILNRGLNPIIRLTPPTDMESDFYEIANDKQLSFVTPGEEILMSSIQGAIYVRAPEQLTHLENIDPEKQNIVALSHNFLKKIMQKRQLEKTCSWTLGAYPTPARASHANLTLEVYADKVKTACHLDASAPLSVWKDFYEQIEDTKKWLLSLDIQQIHVESEQIDLRLSLGDQRKWLGLSGRNIPSFEIFTSPDWRTIDGTYYSDQAAFVNGNFIKDIRLSFDNGCIVKATAETGETFLNKRLKTDSGASRVGEFSLTDKRFSKIDSYMADILFDENYGGTYGNCHIALGSSFDAAYNAEIPKLSRSQKESLGLNDSVIHWDIINTEPKVVTAKLSSGKKQVIYENGVFIK